MTKFAPLLSFVIVLLLFCAGCSNIKLGGDGKSGTGGGSAAAVVNPKVTPPITGDWRITFVYQDNPYDSDVVFSQKGKALAGEGKDSTGVPFMIQNGEVQNNQVRFTKRYVDADPGKPPVEYIGEISYQEDEGYRGWSMGGHYKTTLADGTVVDDKWIALSKEAEALFAQQQQQQPPQQEQQAPPPQQIQQQQVEQPGPDNSATTHSGSAPNISGQYVVSYKRQFKKIFTKMWLAQDGTNITGHGVDTNTNEKFTVVKGSYKYPKIDLICRYAKGRNAAATRDLHIVAKVTSGPTMHGETEWGGEWEARIVR